MESETIQIIIIATGIVGAMILGGILFFLSRWAQKKNAELKVKGTNSQIHAFRSEMSQRTFMDRIKAYFAGTMSKQEAFIGKFIAVFIILFVSIFLVFACIAIMEI
jgi:Mn2+/Fe2+ NRAMP family transporter